jgi:glycosyltransferase involved in cell wall biosynthesis
MPSLTLCQLPQPSAGQSGWPWTKETPPLPPLMPNGQKWPKISVVTPNYNYRRFLEDTIRSVLLQSYPNLEYIVMDGGSDDGSLEIIRKYEQWLTWESKPDAGSSNAINKGLRLATGDILTFLNSDDYYQPGTLAEIACMMDAGQKHYVVMGDINQVNAQGKLVRVWKARTPSFYSLLFQYRLCRIGGIVVMPNQPSVFWHRHVHEKLGYFREDLQYAFDYEYWLRMLANGFKFHNVHEIYSNYRFHPESLSYQGWQGFYPEWKKVSAEYLEGLPGIAGHFAKLYWWLVLFPISILTFPHRGISYLLGVKRG